MRQFFLILKNYLFRFSQDPIGLAALLGLPVGIILVNVVIFSANADSVMVNGYNVAASEISTMIMVMFQFFSGAYIFDAVYLDFRGDRRWRLYSAPVSQNKFFFTAAAASWLVTAVQGLIIVVITSVFLNAYWGNIGVLLLAIALLSAVAQIISIIISQFVKVKKTAEAVSMVIIFAMAIINGMMPINIPGDIGAFLRNLPTPMRLGFNAIIDSGFIGNDMDNVLFSLGILAAIFAGLVVIAAIIGRRRKI